MTTPSAPPLPRDHLVVALKLARRTLRHAWLGAIALLVGAGLTVAVLGVRPKQYRSQTVLYYQEGFQWDLSSEGARRVGPRLRETVLAWSRLQQLVVELGLFPELVAAGKMDDALEEMRRRTTFSVNDGDTFTLAFVGDSPQDAQRVTAALAQSLINENARLRSTQIELAKSFLDTQRGRNEESLREKEAELARFLGKHPEVAAAGGPGNAAMGVVSRHPAAPEPARQPAASPDAPAELVAAERQTQSQLAAARRDFEEQSGRFTEKHPAVAAAAARLREAEAAHRRAADALAAATRGRPAAAASGGARQPRIRAEVLQEYARLTRELEEERERFQQLDTKQFVASMAASSFTGGHSAQITVVDPAYLPARPTGTSNTVLLLAGLAASLALGLAAALLGAVLDDRVYDRSDLERLGLAPVLAEILGLGKRKGSAGAGGRDEARAEAAAERSVDEAPVARLASVGQRAALSPAPELRPAALAGNGSPQPEPTPPSAISPIGVAQPPALAGDGRKAGARGAAAAARRDDDPADRRLVLLRAPDSAPAASFRILRHRLSERGGPKIILVTSPGPDEGKTTCALNLALALCEAGRAKVLLLDGNFRSPALGRIFRARPPDGPGKRPELHSSRPWAVIEPVTTWLDFAAIPPDAVSRFVDGLSLRFRLEQIAAEGYDHIVIDGPPVLGRADVNLVEDMVSGVLLTAWTHRSRASRLREAMDQIGRHKVLGVVLMGR